MAEMTLQGIWTQKGLDKETAFRVGGERKKLTHVAIGDGNGSIPIVSPAQAGLVREVWRGLVNAIMSNPDDPTDLLVDIIIPNNVGGFWIREWGIFDEDGDLVAVGPHDEMHKPLISTGQSAEFLERFHLPSANAGFVEIKIASQALATQQYVEDKILEHDKGQAAHNALARKSVQIVAGTGLLGGGSLEANRTLAVKYGTAAGTACQGDDARLNNARSPVAHKATHATGGTDAITPADIGAAVKTVQIKAGTGLTGGGSLEADRALTVNYGTAAGTVCQGNDARLSNARTPTAHKATHITGGTDAIAPADIGAVPATVQVIAGTGLSGGGSLAANRTFALKYGTVAGTACQGNDVRVTATEAFRLSMIGVPRYWRSTTLPEHHVWANGDLVLFSDWPELKKVYDGGGFSGMLLAYNADNATIAANLGKWRPNAANPTGLYVPKLSEQFFRAWTGGSREAGSAQGDAIQTDITSLSSRYIGTWYVGAGPASVSGDVTQTSVADSNATTLQSGGIGDGYAYWTVNQRMADETRPVNIAITIIIYLGEQ